MKRFASAAAVAVGLHLLLFSVEVDRRDIGKRVRLQPDGMIMDLMAAPPRVERPSPPSPALPPTPPSPPESVAGYKEPMPAPAPKRAAGAPEKVPRPPRKKSPAETAAPISEPNAAEIPAAEPAGQTPSKVSGDESPVGDGRLSAGHPAGPRPSAAAGSSEASRTAPAPTLQAATPDYDRNPPPEYPRRARQLGFEGTVLLRVWVNPSGGVDRAEIAASSGYAVLDDSALSAVKGWRFKAARQGGQPVAALVQVPVRFALTSSATEIP